ncbi:MAG: rhomboid family intramembrane serine protease [Nanoarchaeota archaeon]
MKYNIRAALWLSFVIFIIFLLQVFIEGLADYFILDTGTVSFKPYTLITAIFLHSGIPHLFYNLFGLALFGSILEHIIGSKRFLILFFIAGLAASLVSIPFYARVLGASGAIFGILGMLGILRPKLTVWVYSMPMPMILALFVWAAADMLGVFVPTDTANIAHLAGLAVGIVAGLYYKKDFAEKKIKEKEVYVDEEKVKEWEKSF